VKNLCSISGYFFTSLALALLLVGVLGMPSNVMADPPEVGDPIATQCLTVQPQGGCVEPDKVCTLPNRYGLCGRSAGGFYCTCV